MKIQITVSENEITELKRIRGYFGENDKTTFEHHAYTVMDGFVKRLESLHKIIEIKDIKEGVKIKANWDGAIHVITKIKDDIVTYKGLSYQGEWEDQTCVIIADFELCDTVV